MLGFPKILRKHKPDAILCLNGVLPEKDYWEQLPSDIVIVAADGAAERLEKSGIIPQYIIGDMDSLADKKIYWESQRGVEVHSRYDQNSTDFEKSLEFLAHRNLSKILVLGMHGGEIDHSLNNWSILARYGKKLYLTAGDNDKSATPLYESFDYASTPNELISLIPQPLCHISTTGLQWNLLKEDLALGRREGARNRATGQDVRITIHTGSLLFIVPEKTPSVFILEERGGE
jgi:thiamine pyrophosphokinase